MLAINLIYSQSKDWVNLFLKLGKYPFSDGYQNSKVTPYIHIMVYHVPTFIDKYKSVKQFSSQGSYIDKQILHFMHVGWTFIFQALKKTMMWLRQSILRTATNGMLQQTFLETSIDCLSLETVQEGREIMSKNLWNGYN